MTHPHRWLALLAGMGAATVRRGSLSLPALALVLALAPLGPGAAAQSTTPRLDAAGHGSWRVGTVSVRIAAYEGRDQPAGSFMLSAIESRQPVMFASRAGACEPSATVAIAVQDTPQHEFGAFLASRSGRDLPLGELLAAARQALELRCPGIQVIRVTLESAYRARKYAYEGTMQRSQGWALQDGHVPTEHDAGTRVSFALADFFDRARIEHTGRCEEAPTLLLRAALPPALDRQLSLITNYTALAESAALRYAQTCRQVQRLRFALAPLPREYRCAAGTECFLEARRNGTAWQVSMEQLAARTERAPIQTVDDIAEVLAAGRFDVLSGYDAYFAFFVSQHFLAYSEQCREHIRDPVTRVHRRKTVKRDGQGHVVSEEISESRPITLERSLAWAYDTHDVGPHIWQVTMAGVAAGINGMALVLGDTQRMNALLRSQCTSDRNLTIRENMLNRAGNREPVTGKYSTDKVPRVSVDENANSAPVFVAAYLREQAAAMNPAPQPPQPRPQPAPGADAGTTAAPPNRAALQERHQQELQQLDQAYRTQLQQAGNPLTRLKVEGEYRFQRLQLQRRHQDELRRTPP